MKTRWNPGPAKVGIVFVAVAASLGACDAPTTSDPVETTEPELVARSAPPRRLLGRQYRGSVAELLGAEAAAVATPPDDPELYGYQSIASAELTVSADLVAIYESSAIAVASAAMASNPVAALIPCSPDSATDTVCFRRFVESFGRRAFRRPLDDNELKRYVEVGRGAAALDDDFYAGIEWTIAAILQSPNFLYQLEFGERPVEEGRPELGLELTAYEYASRLSFLLLDRAPDESLLDAAEDGTLDTPEGRRQIAAELLTRPEAAKAMRSFFVEYLALEGLETKGKDPSAYPEFSAEFAHDMTEETMRLVSDVVWDRDAPMTELLTADYTFVNPALARHYGTRYDTDVPEPGGPEAWQRQSLRNDRGRIGIMTQASMMSQQAHATTTSPLLRGLFVMERFLCESMPPPPASVVTDLPPSSAAPTMRERLAIHQEDATCRFCHIKADAFGLTFENFDAIGRYRNHENDSPIDTTGEAYQVGPWSTPRQLMTRLAEMPETTNCMTRQMARHAFGRLEQNSERPWFKWLAERAMAANFRYRALMVELVTSRGFRSVAIINPGGEP